MLINLETSEALDILYGSFFQLNALLDRAQSVLNNDFTMPNASKYIHNLAHNCNGLADVVSEIKDNYNLSSIRPEVHKDDRNYSNLADMFSTVLKEFSEVYEIMNKVVDIAIAHRDRNVTSDMYRLFRKYNIIMGQVNTLNDKAQQMPTDFDKFDFNISKWGIKGVKL
jgi:hypothetical protein